MFRGRRTGKCGSSLVLKLTERFYISSEPDYEKKKKEKAPASLYKLDALISVISSVPCLEV